MNRKRWQSIGIIGGFGPRASAYFYKLLIDICSREFGAVQDNEYPHIHLVSLASDGLCETGVEDEEDLVADLDYALNVLKELNIGLIALACNSLYTVVGKAGLDPGISLVNLPEELAMAIAKLKAKDALILSGQVVKEDRSFDKYFFARGINPHYPETQTLGLIEKWALQVMANRHSPQMGMELLATVRKLSRQYDAVIIACSELSVLVESLVLPPNVIDSMYVLAQATLRRSRFFSIQSTEQS